MALSKLLHIFFIRHIPSIVYAKMQLSRLLTFFLRQKNRPIYQRALQILIELQKKLQPGSIMCDFEKAIRGNVKGCYFHPPFPVHMAPYSRAKSITDIQRKLGVTIKDENIVCSCFCTT